MFPFSGVSIVAAAICVRINMFDLLLQSSWQPSQAGDMFAIFVLLFFFFLGKGCFHGVPELFLILCQR